MRDYRIIIDVFRELRVADQGVTIPKVPVIIADV